VTVPTGGEVAVEKTLDISEVLAVTVPAAAEAETVEAEILE
jgi:hypothetical protein